MGFHVCWYCVGGNVATSSGDVVLAFSSGNTYQVPDMIVHYVEDHGWVPPVNFVQDVITSTLLEPQTKRYQTKSVKLPELVGYLTGDANDFSGGVSDTFKLKLRQLLDIGGRSQTRGIR